MNSFFCDKAALLKPVLRVLLLSSFSLAAFAQNPVIQTETDDQDTIMRGFKPKVGTSQFYIAYVGVAYSIVKHRGGKRPYAASHTFGLNYSPVLNSLHPYYESFFPQAIGKWDLNLLVGYDGLRRMNYYGLGNETKRQTNDNRFHWMRTRQQYASLGLTRKLGNYHTINWGAFYDGIQLLNDENRYVGKSRQTVDPSGYNWQYFLGGRVSYSYIRLNNPELPTKGLDFNVGVGYTENLKNGDRSFARYTTDLDVYIPLPSSFSLAVRSGISTVSGEPDFYQYNSIGGGRTVRGYRRWRFYGKTAFYNQNELRWITEVDKGGLNGHFGFLVLYDQGKVWQPGESSDKMHFGYGGGVILAPFDKIVVTATFAISNEDKRTHFRVGKSF